ncbi:MAG: hypothetical protein OEY01_02495 [Desulfobulbaceae bacterium]|nr:hypothetical protein [Desulfobulbaceae bacterium]HIJ78160.1 hypothetical protein [Deltaproteobacteria bacterium]
MARKQHHLFFDNPPQPKLFFLTIIATFFFACTIITSTSLAAPPPQTDIDKTDVLGRENLPEPPQKHPSRPTATQVNEIANWEAMTTVAENSRPQKIHWLTFPAWQEKIQSPQQTQESNPERYQFDLNSYQPQECVRCHKNSYDKNMEKDFIHLPFAKKDCPICHVSLDLRRRYRVQVNYPYKFVVAQQIPVTKINRPIPSETDNSGQGATTPQANNQRESQSFVYLRTQTENGNSLMEEIPLPPLETLPALDPLNSAQPFAISDLKVTRITKALFISATITFNTNRLAKAEIRNVEPENDFQTDKINSPAYIHTRTLTGLKADADYLFDIICTDLAGNKVQLTRQTLSVKGFTPEPNENPDDSPLATTNNFYKNGDNYIVQVTTNKKTKVSLKKIPPNVKGDGWELPGDHPTITTRREMNIDICHICHEYPGGHPVNKTPPQDMTIPTEYPTLSDGRITCMSCHIGHSANIPYRARKKNNRELCLGCHKSKQQGKTRPLPF